MAVQIKGTTYNAETDSANNLFVNTPLNEDIAGHIACSAENDAGTVTGTRTVKSMEVTNDYRLRTGQDNTVFNDCFSGAAINTTIWDTALTTMTNTVTNGFSVLNAGSSTASGAVALQRTWRHMPSYKQFTTQVEAEIQFTQTPQSNNVCEWGLGIVANFAVTAPTDGVFFRMTATGTFLCVVSYNGVETTSSPLDFATLVGTNTTRQFLIYLNSTVAQFWIDNILVAEIAAPAGQASITSSMSLPIMFRNYNSAATALAQQMKIGQVSCIIGDTGMSKPWGHVMTGNGQSSTQGQTGATLGSTAIYTNAAAAAAAALTNTTAAAQFTGLGGIANYLPTLTAGTDGILFSYQVPAGTATLPGRSLYISGVSLDGVVTTVLAGGPIINSVSIAYGHTAVSLATAESATTKAPRRVPLGIQNWAATAAVGAQCQRLQDDYTVAPIVVQPGEFIQIVIRNLGTVTTTGAITYVCSFTGYWE